MDYISKEKAKDIISEFYGESESVNNVLARMSVRISEEPAPHVMEVKTLDEQETGFVPVSVRYRELRGELDAKNGVLHVFADNRCVCCGAIIPEGRMVCPICERR